MQDALKTDGLLLYAYCLLPNHFHLLVETPRGNIDQFMGRLQTAYAMYFRYKHYRPGHCFQGRYKAPLASGDDYLARLSRYIHLNPICVSGRELWEGGRKWGYLKAYPWSSLRGYLDGKAREEFVNYRWLGLFDEAGGKEARRAYARFIRGQIGHEDKDLLEATGSGGYAIGSEEFRREVMAWVKDEAEGDGVIGDVEIPEAAETDAGTIEKVVTGEYNLKPEDLRRAHEHLGDARGTYIELLCTVGRRTQREAAAILETGEHAVCKCRRRFRERVRAERPVAQRLAALTEKCRQAGNV
jgi:REP element-mobilizing transposase RayT